MILNLITLATVKTHLGLSVTTYDAAITAMIPIVSNDIRRILNDNFITYVPATILSGDTSFYAGKIENGSFVYAEIPDGSGLQLGQVIYTPNVPTDTYITAYAPSTGKYTMSEDPTADADYFYLGLNIGQWPAVAKMIYYKTTKMTIGAATKKGGLSSNTYGNVSKTFSASEINKKYDYPITYLNELGAPYARVG